MAYIYDSTIITNSYIAYLQFFSFLYVDKQYIYIMYILKYFIIVICVLL